MFTDQVVKEKPLMTNALKPDSEKKYIGFSLMTSCSHRIMHAITMIIILGHLMWYPISIRLDTTVIPVLPVEMIIAIIIDRIISIMK